MTGGQLTWGQFLSTGGTLLQLAQKIEMAGNAPTDEQTHRAASRSHNRALWRATKPFVGQGCVSLKPLRAPPGSFQARDNVAVCRARRFPSHPSQPPQRFVQWCQQLQLPQFLCFESEDLILGLWSHAYVIKA
jgi:hypothetical protein